jgi:hypothetical protein
MYTCVVGGFRNAVSEYETLPSVLHYFPELRLTIATQNHFHSVAAKGRLK